MHSNPNKAGKYKWSFDENSGLIYSVGSEFNYCLKINSLTRKWQQRVKVYVCNESDDLQKFDFVNSQIRSRMNGNLCAGYDAERFGIDAKAPLVLTSCFPNAFAIG